MKYLVLAVALAAAGTVCAADKKPVDSCVKVVSYIGDEDKGQKEQDDGGSGTVVMSRAGKSLVLTNRHVVSDEEVPLSEIEYDVMAKGSIYEARLVAYSKYDDLALLEVTAELPAVKVASEPPEFGSTVYEFGFPRGRRQKAQSGEYFHYGAIFTNDKRWGGYKPGMKTDPQGKYYGGSVEGVRVPGKRGKSGSGVLNGRGELVGVVWGGRDHDVVVGYEEVKKFLRENLPAAN
jgi:S1-C subfamily serine protease